MHKEELDTAGSLLSKQSQEASEAEETAADLRAMLAQKQKRVEALMKGAVALEVLTPFNMFTVLKYCHACLQLAIRSGILGQSELQSSHTCTHI